MRLWPPLTCYPGLTSQSPRLHGANCGKVLKDCGHGILGGMNAQSVRSHSGPTMGTLPCRIQVYLRSRSGPDPARELAFVEAAPTVPKLAVVLLHRRIRDNFVMSKIWLSTDPPFYCSSFSERSNWSQYGPGLPFLESANYEASYPKRHQGVATLRPLAGVRTVRFISKTRYCRRTCDFQTQ